MSALDVGARVRPMTDGEMAGDACDSEPRPARGITGEYNYLASLISILLAGEFPGETGKWPFGCERLVS